MDYEVFHFLEESTKRCKNIILTNFDDSISLIRRNCVPRSENIQFLGMLSAAGQTKIKNLFHSFFHAGKKQIFFFDISKYFKVGKNRFRPLFFFSAKTHKPHQTVKRAAPQKPQIFYW
jgi:hypothetical protein